jgi:hypothetical protein
VQTRTGSCHCGTVVFRVDLDNGLKDLRRCNCSLCRRKGAIMASVPLDRLRVIKGADNLTLYQWNTRTAKHYFCKACGIYTHHQRRSHPDEYGFNIACLEGVDLAAVGEVGLADGAAMSLEHSPPSLS